MTGVGILGGAWLAMLVGPAVQAADAGAFTGVWGLVPGQERLAPVAGGEPPLRPWAAEVYARAREDIQRRANEPPGLASCVPAGLPRLMFSKQPFQLLAGPDLVLFVHQENHQPRFVHMATARPDPPITGFLGHSIGRWDGETLVVETVGFDRPTALDDRGLPHGDGLRVVERLTLRDGGDVLEDRITIHDDETFTRPWDAVVKFERRPGARIAEDLCALRVAREGAPP